MGLLDRLARPQGVSRASVRPSDIVRILSLPIEEGPDDWEVEEFNAEFAQAKARQEGFEFFPEQVDGVTTFREYAGLFGPIGVGFGKTLISFLCAQIAWEDYGHQRIGLFVPPGLATKTNQDLRAARRQIKFVVPTHKVHGLDKKKRHRLANSAKRGMFIFPYSFLEVQDAPELLKEFGFTCYIFDEAHRLANMKAPSTARMLHAIDEQRKAGEDVNVALLSGTMTKKGLKDYYHTIVRALGDGAPLPLTRSMAMRWDGYLGASNIPEVGAKAELRPIFTWACREFPDDDILFNEEVSEQDKYRHAYHLRLASSPGVVASSDREIGTSLIIEKVDTRRPKDSVTDAIRVLESEMIAPTGEELDYPIEAFRWAFELTSGFYHEQYWPEVEDVAHSQGCSRKEAKIRLEESVDHFELVKEWHKLFRVWYQDHSEPGLDTPLTVGQHMYQKGRLPGDNIGLFAAWQEARDAKPEFPVERLSRPIWMDTQKVEAAVEWVQSLKKSEGGVLWCYHKTVRERTVKALQEAGFNPVDGVAGDKDVERLLLKPGAVKGRPLVLSIRSYKEGHNLQYRKDQLFVQYDRQADIMEQALGRLHRSGQEADEITASWLWSTPTDTDVFLACLVDSVYIHTTMSKQKLVKANHLTDIPVGRLRGLSKRVEDVKQLDPMQERILRDKLTSEE